jgi:membrane dipeptidase
MKSLPFMASLTALVLLFSVLNCSSQEKIDKELWKKALEIHGKAIVIDTHADTPMNMLGEGFDIGKRSDKGHIDLIRMKEGGLDALFMAAYVSQSLADKDPAHHALELIDVIYQQVETNADKAEMAFSPQDIRRLHKEGKAAILIGIENGIPIEESLRLLRMFYRLGVRYMTLCHSGTNFICDSSTDKPKWDGVSDIGKKVIQEMNDLGMMIDVSHISDGSFWDVLELSKAPVIASHSCCRAISNAERNLTDEMIKALAKKGGVIQIAYVPDFLSQKYLEKSEKKRKELQPKIDELREKYKDNQKELYAQFTKLYRQNPIPLPPVSIIVDHIDHVAKLAGVDYVGLGSDFDGTFAVPEGLEDVSKLPIITYHLLKRGYTEEDIVKILGGNLLRVFAEVQKAAQQSK